MINFPSEHSKFRDSATGAIMHQMTSGDAINHPTYFLQSSFLPDGSEIFFTSYSTGAAQLFIAGYPAGEIRQLTGGRAIHPFSPISHPAGERIFFVRGGGIWWVDRRSRAEHLVPAPTVMVCLNSRTLSLGSLSANTGHRCSCSESRAIGHSRCGKGRSSRG